MAQEHAGPQDFRRLPDSDPLALACASLWAQRSGATQGLLTPWSSTCTNSRPILGTADGEHVDLSDSSSHESIPTYSRAVQYLDLNQYPGFIVFFACVLGTSDNFVILRSEYQELLTHVLARRRHYFLTGQPGIGEALVQCLERVLS